MRQFSNEWIMNLTLGWIIALTIIHFTSVLWTYLGTSSAGTHQRKEYWLGDGCDDALQSDQGPSKDTDMECVIKWTCH